MDSRMASRSAALIEEISSGEMEAVRGSPGVSSSPIKTTRLITNIMGINSNIRVTKYFNMIGTAPFKKFVCYEVELEVKEDLEVNDTQRLCVP